MTPPAADEPLDLFCPLVREWFLETLGTPTRIQREGWAAIAGGEHVLLSASTGSGKTLAAFLWAIDRLLSGEWSPGVVRVLYVSPLRALGNDVKRNLLRPLEQIDQRAIAQGIELPRIGVETRSGDTPRSARARMLRRPPEILITTPESLNLLLTSQGGRALLGGVTTLILDEIHAVAGNKRGAHLASGVERLVDLSGEFQRVALSATVRPLDKIARFVGGYRREGVATAPRYLRRPVLTVEDGTPHELEIEVRTPRVRHADGESDEWWRSIAAELRTLISERKSTLVFTRSRKMSEQMTRWINEEAGRTLAYSHHGSLSREIRLAVEERMKRGELPAIVATSSLELGIDVGELDQVVLVGAPFTVSSALQRIGRAGHRVGQVSRAVIYPAHTLDLLGIAAVTRAALARDIEELHPVRAPLDVLAQIIVSMAVSRSWEPDELYAALRASESYHDLSREHFELVLEMLAGRCAETRLRELTPRIRVDRQGGAIEARRGARLVVYSSGGTIPDRGYYDLRHVDTGAKIGELDEEFVWERRPGESFILGANAWRIERITDRDVLVRAAARKDALVPFWRAEEWDSSSHLAGRVGELLERAEECLAGGGELEPMLAQDYRLAPPAVAELGRMLRAQRELTRSPLPHRRHILLERCLADRPADLAQWALHTFWGGQVNRPLSLAMASLWRRRTGRRLEITATNDCVLLAMPEDEDPEALLHGLAGAELESLVLEGLAHSGFLGARFREAAGRALLLPRRGFGHRTPLWMLRRRAARLLDAVGARDRFPVLIEAWRTCLEDSFEMAVLAERLGELAAGRIALSRCVSGVTSPFAKEVIWRRANTGVYEDDRPEPGSITRPRRDLLREFALSSELRPRLEPAWIEAFEQRARRLLDGYAPADAGELLDWVRERAVFDPGEWRRTLEASARDGGSSAQQLERVLAPRLTRFRFPGAAVELIAAADEEPRLTRAARADGADLLTDLVGQWLRFYGPIAVERVTALFGPAGEQALERLAESETVVIDGIAGDRQATEACDRENLEVILRLARAARRPLFEARPAEELPLLLATLQGVVEPARDPDALRRSLGRLLGYPAPAADWEREILPARAHSYHPTLLDGLMQSGGPTWIGCGRMRLTFSFVEDGELLDLARGARAEEDEPIPLAEGQRLTLSEMLQQAGLADSGALTRRLWRAAWAGEVSSEGFQVVRQGIRNRFAPTPLPVSRERGGRRGAFRRWRESRPLESRWYRLPSPAGDLDAAERDEIERDRARMLLDRYGVVFRELLGRELPALRWGRVFRALRLLELAGECTSGVFFSGLPGLQFASSLAVAQLQQGLPGDAIWSVAATDPASPCGLGRAAPIEGLPPRRSGTLLSFRGARLVVVARRQGKVLEIRCPVDEPGLADCLAFLGQRLRRSVDPPPRIEIETINGEAAKGSAWEPILRGIGFAGSDRGLVLERV